MCQEAMAGAGNSLAAPGSSDEHTGTGGCGRARCGAGNGEKLLEREHSPSWMAQPLLDGTDPLMSGAWVLYFMFLIKGGWAAAQCRGRAGAGRVGADVKQVARLWGHGGTGQRLSPRERREPRQRELLQEIKPPSLRRGGGDRPGRNKARTQRQRRGPRGHGHSAGSPTRTPDRDGGCHQPRGHLRWHSQPGRGAGPGALRGRGTRG